MRHFLSFINLLFGLALLPLFSCQPTNSREKISNSAFVITNVNIIDVNNGNIHQGHVVIDSTQIQEILDLETAIDKGNGTLIDGTDKYLIPGLAEMHAHIPSLPWDDPKIAETLFLYLSNGVTTIRGMLGHPAHLELREKAANQEILSPRIYTSSPSINGNTVTNPEDARSQVTAYAQEGYDFLKIHPGLRLHVFDEVVKTANEVGIPFAGHVSTMVGVRHALESKYATIDHVDSYLEGLVPEEENVNPTENGFFGYNFTNLADTSNIPELVEMSKANQVWVVPTQSLFDRWFSPTDPEILAQETEMSYISPETLDNWIQSKKNLISDPNYDSATWVKFNEIRSQLIKALHDEGQGLLLGSDAPQVFNVPGFSIHHELKGMINAGLSPLEAIQIGTINPARFFEGSFGEIKAGLDADLILLERNPLDNIENLKNPIGVMARGQWMDRNMIDKKLKEIAKVYSTN
ncbi:MAG: amidohydrolase family protein [Anditalea sp.]